MFLLLYPKRVPKYLPFPCLSCFVFFVPYLCPRPVPFCAALSAFAVLPYWPALNWEGETAERAEKGEEKEESVVEWRVEALASPRVLWQWQPPKQPQTASAAAATQRRRRRGRKEEVGGVFSGAECRVSDSVWLLASAGREKATAEKPTLDHGRGGRVQDVGGGEERRRGGAGGRGHHQDQEVQGQAPQEEALPRLRAPPLRVHVGGQPHGELERDARDRDQVDPVPDWRRGSSSPSPLIALRGSHKIEQPLSQTFPHSLQHFLFNLFSL